MDIYILYIYNVIYIAFLFLEMYKSKDFFSEKQSYTVLDHITLCFDLMMKSYSIFFCSLRLAQI